MIYRRFERLTGAYDRASIGGAWITDFVVGASFWVVVLVSFIAVLVGVSHAVTAFANTSTSQTTVSKLSDDMSTYATDAHAIITPPTDISGATNCNGSNDCREVDYLFRTTTGDVYLGYDFVPPSSGTIGMLKIYTFSGFTSADAHISPVLRQTIPMQAFSVHPVLASAMNSDTQDEFASLVSSLESQAGITPQDVTLNYGAPLAIARNAVYVVSLTSSTGSTFSFPMTQESIAPKNLRLDVGTYAPTPPPTLTYTGSTLLYHWPTDTSVNAFQVSEAYYHDPFFAEQGTCTNIAAPNPQYIPGSSPTYYPSTMFGQTGPWQYPNPNPTSPPGQNSGPATFGTAPATGNSGGYCSYYIYDVYTNRTSNTPSATVPVQVMGWLTLIDSGGSGSWPAILSSSTTATSQTSPLPVSHYYTAKGDAYTIYASKGFDNDASGLNLSVNLGSCASYLALQSGSPQNDGVVSGSGPTGTEGAGITFVLTTVPSNPLACSGTVTDQYNEPAVSFSMKIDPATLKLDIHELLEVWFNNSTGQPTTYSNSSNLVPCANDPAQATQCGTIIILNPPGDTTPPANSTNCSSGCVEQDSYYDMYSTTCHCYVQKAQKSIVESDTYEQYGYDATTRTIAGYYHYPLVSGDLSATWCQNEPGTSGSAPCTDKTTYNIPGVWYPANSKPTL